MLSIIACVMMYNISITVLLPPPPQPEDKQGRAGKARKRVGKEMRKLGNSRQLLVDTIKLEHSSTC